MSSLAALGIAYHAHGTHLGVYYEVADGILELLHLSEHNGLTSEPESHYYLNVDTRFAFVQRLAVSNLCRLFYRRFGASRTLRYSAARTDSILLTGELAIDEPGVGFTCSTLVMELFEANQAELVDKKSWPAAALDDRVWLRNLITYYRSVFNLARDRLHFDNVDESCKWSRFLPEEVAAAATLAPPAAKHKNVKKGASRLLNILKSTRPQLEPVPVNRGGATVVPAALSLAARASHDVIFTAWSGHDVFARSGDSNRACVSPARQVPIDNGDGTASATITIKAGAIPGMVTALIWADLNEAVTVTITVME